RGGGRVPAPQPTPASRPKGKVAASRPARCKPSLRRSLPSLRVPPEGRGGRRVASRRSSDADLDLSIQDNGFLALLRPREGPLSLESSQPPEQCTRERSLRTSG